LINFSISELFHKSNTFFFNGRSFKYCIIIIWKYVFKSSTKFHTILNILLLLLFDSLHSWNNKFNLINVFYVCIHRSNVFSYYNNYVHSYSKFCVLLQPCASLLSLLNNVYCLLLYINIIIIQLFLWQLFLNLLY